MKIIVVTDAWLPQTNGVVRTLLQTSQWLTRSGHDVKFISPDQFTTVPCPSYPEIRLAVLPYQRLARLLKAEQPQAIHIATEGPLGLAARRYCRRNGLGFTTSYHTQFPEYVRLRAPVPLSVSYRVLRWFHGAATRCMVSTDSVRDQLIRHGFTNIVRWGRGVDTELFRPRDKNFLNLPRPIAVYIGRVAVEKNINAFLVMPWQGTKLIIGDGPERVRLQQQFPAAVFVGVKHGEELASHLAVADVMVFPSRTDTFGLVNLEAMACGVPVAAYPVAGPRDVIQDGITGALDEDLATAVRRALTVDPKACRDYALQTGWDVCARQFESHLHVLHARVPRWQIQCEAD